MNGICDKPLMKDGKILYYSYNPTDYAYEYDEYDRIAQNLRPILNLS